MEGWDGMGWDDSVVEKGGGEFVGEWIYIALMEMDVVLSLCLVWLGLDWSGCEIPVWSVCLAWGFGGWGGGGYGVVWWL